MKEADHIRILCYGDSNTWGAIGRWQDSDLPSFRFEPETRWTGVLQSELGDGYRVLEEGLGGRTSVYARAGEEWKCGAPCFKPALFTHRPLDWVVLLLGTNDLQTKLDMTAEELPLGVSRLIDIVRDSPKTGRGMTPPEILLIAPTEIVPSDPNGRTGVYAKFRGDIGRRLSLLFPDAYARLAREKGCHFLNAQEFAKPCPADGVHLDADSHVRLGKAVAAYLRARRALEEEAK